MKYCKKGMSLFLCVVLCLSFFPFPAAYAEEGIVEETEPVSVSSELEPPAYEYRERPEENTVLEEIVADTETRQEEDSLIIEEKEDPVLETVVEEETVSDAPMDAVIHSDTWGRLRWSLDDSGLLTISGEGTMSDLPWSNSEWREYRNSITAVVIEEGITNIGSYAFANCSLLTDITIPESVTSIGSYAFSYCSGLTGITIPESVTSISYYAFANCSSLTGITIPDGVTSIGSYAFSNCSSLTGITIPDGVTSIGSSAFSNCSSLTGITIPDGVTSFGDYAFSNCSSLTDISIPDGVTSIGSYAFYGCSSLTGITIPDGVTSIGSYAFYGCSSLMSITIPDGVTSIGDSAFSSCRSMTSIEIPESVTSIGGSVFSDCPKLKTAGPIGSDCSIQFGWATAIPEHAFQNCSSLTSITIPNSVVRIGVYAFDGCSDLASIAIPDGVVSIENGTFNRCSSLTSVEIPDGVTSIGGSAFYECRNLMSIVIPDGVTSIGNSAFSSCNSLTSIDIPDGVTSIGDYAFAYCNSLTSIEIPDSVTSIGSYAFQGIPVVYFEGTTEQWNAAYHKSTYESFESLLICLGDEEQITASGTCGSNVSWALDNRDVLMISGSGSMTNYSSDSDQPWGEYRSSIIKIRVQDGVSSIGDGAFYSLYRTAEVDIAESVTSIGNSAFSNCSSLTSITIPDGVTSIGSYAFNYCSSLTGITIPNSVTSIGNSAFYYCRNLTSIEIPAGVTSIGDYAFYGCSSLSSVTIPEGVMSIGSSAFADCPKLKTAGPIGSDCNIQFGWTAAIPEYAFQNCSSLTSITIPNSVASIGFYAFDGCSDLASIAIPNGVVSIENGTFNRCSSLTSVAIPEGVMSIGYQAFSYCSSLTSIEIPEGVTSIDGSAFENCSNLKMITIPSSVTSIGSNAFYSCSNVTDVYYGASEARKNTLLQAGYYNGGWYADSDGTLLRNAVWHYAETEPGWDFCGPDLFWSYDGTTGTLSIKGTGEMWPALTENRYSDAYFMPWDAYRDEITAVAMESGITVISDRAFANLPYLQEISIPATVTAIGEYAFQNDIRLTAMMLPEGVRTIGRYAFDHCSRLANISIPDTLTGIGEYAFNYCGKLAGISLPNGMTAVERGTFYYCNNMTEIILPNSLTDIGEYAFYYCSRLANAAIPASVTEIGQSAFYGCSALSGITLPAGLTCIENSVFSSCTGLISIAIPDGVTDIRQNAFSSCSRLESVKLPETVKNIGSYAFSWCSNLTEITVPLSVRNIDSYAFQNVPVVFYQGTAAQWEMVYNLAINETFSSLLICLGDTPNIVAVGKYGNNISWYLDGDGVLTLAGSGSMREPNSSDFGYPGTESTYPWYAWRSSIKKIVVGEGITSVSGFAFRLSAVREVLLPEGLRTISPVAFEQCYDLTTVNLPDSLESIGNYAFYVTSIRHFDIPASTSTIGGAALCTRNLESITVKAGNTRFVTDSRGILYDKSRSGQIWISENNSRSYSNRYALIACPNTFSGSLNIDSRVTVIDMQAFEGCSRLSSVILPEGLWGIGSFAFANTGLSQIYFQGTPPTAIGQTAFKDLTAKAFYPAGRGWGTSKMQNYGGNLTWIPFDPDDSVTFQTTLNLADYTGIFVYIGLPEGEDAAAYTVEASYHSYRQNYTMGPVALNTLPKGSGARAGMYKFEPLRAASTELSDTVTVTLKKDGAVVRTEEYSVRGIAEARLAAGEVTGDAATLHRALLQYGRYGQIVFNNRTDDLPGTEGAPALLPIPAAYAAKGDPTNFSAYVTKFEGKLDLNSAISMNLYLTPAKGYSRDSFQISVLDKDGNAYSKYSVTTDSSNRIRIRVEGILSPQMARNFRVVVTLKSNPARTATWTRSVLSCAYTTEQTNTNANVKSLMQALYQYYVYAVRVFPQYQ